MGTLSNELSAILDDIDDAYDALAAQGATLPAAANRGTYQLVDTIATIPRPQLHAPSISRNDDTITITNPSTNGNFVANFAVYNGDSMRGTLTGTSFTLSGLGAGTYEVSVKARGTDFADSPKSNVINASVYSITRTLTNLTANNSTTAIANGMTYTVTITPASGYYLPDSITVTVGGRAANYTYDSYTGVITIPSVNGNVAITAVADDVNRLRRPELSLSGSVLTVAPALHSESTYIYVNGALKSTISGTTAGTYDLSTDCTDYGRHAISVYSSASGYADSNAATLTYDVGATIAIHSGVISIVNAISGITGFRVYIDDVGKDIRNYDGSASWSVDMSDYEQYVEDGAHSVALCAIGTGIADNRSNAVTWYVGAAPIYGVSGLYNSSPALTRTDDAVGMTFAINSSSGAIDSDFNEVFPWNVAEVVTDDAGKFVSFPEMYFRIGTDSNSRITDVAVSSQPTGEGAWYRVAPFMYSCYGASISSSKMKSVSGVSRAANYTRAQFRTFATSNGAGYIPIDLYHRNVLMLLWWIEFATKKSDSIMSGRIAGSGTSGGSTVVSCGGTDNVATPSGFETAYGQMRYHYIEDFVGNLWDMVDGIFMNSDGSNDYVTADPSKFDDTSTGKAALSFVNPPTNEIAAYGWDDNNPFLFMPIETVSNSSYDTYFCDRVRHSSGDPVMLAGAGYSNSSAYSGLSYVSYTVASYADAYCGSRLLKIS